MMFAKTRFNPKQSGWYQDLPERDAPPSKQQPGIRQEYVRYMDERFIEISTDENNARGVALAVLVVSWVLVVFSFLFLIYCIFTTDVEDLVWLVGVFIVFFSAQLIMIPVLHKISFGLKDKPILFDRVAKKVYIYSQDILFGKPFYPWPVRQRVCTWDMIQAEVQRLSGYSGYGYIIKYNTLLNICHPDSNDVIERLVLAPAKEERMWEYLRRFMAHGAAELPKLYVPNLDLGFWNSFFHYMRGLDPTERGRDARESLGGVSYIMNLIYIVFFPLGASFGVCHYIATKLAPQARWSPEIAAELKAARYPGPSMKVD